MSFDIETTELAELCEQVIDCPHSTPVWMLESLFSGVQISEMVALT
jgi:hypothetical protein